MGYTTDFLGQFNLNKQLTLDDFNWLNDFNAKDHREEDYYPEYSCYCQWKPTQDGKSIEWDGNEKFYEYIKWLQYLIDNFFAPKDYVLNGTVAFQGEEVGDVGNIEVVDNVITKREWRPQDAEIQDLLKKGLVETEDEPRGHWYLEQIASKLGIELQ